MRDIETEPLPVEAEHGAIVIEGPPGCVTTLTAFAARATALRLVGAAIKAEREPYFPSTMANGAGVR